jgi:hypothetical protein
MPPIDELVSVIRDAGAHEPNAMISLTHRSDDAKWAQLLPDKVNLSYPFDSPPAKTLADLRLPHAEKARPGFWTAKLFADFDTNVMNSTELTEFLVAYLTTVFGTADTSDYGVSFDLAERGTIKAETTPEFLREIVKLKQRLEGKSRRSCGD